MFVLGTSKKIITPQTPLRMCGYANRTSWFQDVKEDLFVRVHYIEVNKNRLLIIYADLLWWHSDFVKKMRDELHKKFGFLETELLFVASHNHSGPGTGNSFIPLLEEADPLYLIFLGNQVILAIEEAFHNKEEVYLKKYHSNCYMNVVRRVITEEGIKMMPNYKVEADSNLTILGYYRRSDETMKASIIHYPCHANLSNENFIQPDYPGIALRMIDEEIGESIAIFLQGCTADLRPNSVLGNQFIACEYSRTVEFASVFANQCLALVKGEGELLNGQLSVSKADVILPLEQKFSRVDIEQLRRSGKIEQKQWAKKVLEKELRNYETMEIHKIDLCGQKIITFNGEIAQYYAQYARDIAKGTISVGYTNGMIGYISTATQIEEGGYEPEGSATYFALAGTYKKDIEQIIKEKMEEVLVCKKGK